MDHEKMWFEKNNVVHLFDYYIETKNSDITRLLKETDNFPKIQKVLIKAKTELGRLDVEAEAESEVKAEEDWFTKKNVKDLLPLYRKLKYKTEDTINKRTKDTPYINKIILQARNELKPVSKITPEEHWFTKHNAIHLLDLYEETLGLDDSTLLQKTAKFPKITSILVKARKKFQIDNARDPEAYRIEQKEKQWFATNKVDELFGAYKKYKADDDETFLKKTQGFPYVQNILKKARMELMINI